MLGLCFLPRRYLRLRAPDGREEHLGAPPPPADLALYRCTGARSPLRRAGEGCGAPLLQARDVLSRQHCWDAGAGPERAWFVNSFVPGSVAARHERREELAQGPMVVADVYCCACGARVGWRFCADLERGLANCNQVRGLPHTAVCDGEMGDTVGSEGATPGGFRLKGFEPPPSPRPKRAMQVGRYGIVRSSIGVAAADAAAGAEESDSSSASENSGAALDGEAVQA